MIVALQTRDPHAVGAVEHRTREDAPRADLRLGATNQVDLAVAFPDVGRLGVARRVMGVHCADQYIRQTVAVHIARTTDP